MNLEQAAELARKRHSIEEEISSMRPAFLSEETADLRERFESLGSRFMALNESHGGASTRSANGFEDRYVFGIPSLDSPHGQIQLKLQAGYSVYDDGREELEHITAYWNAQGIMGRLAMEEVRLDQIANNPNDANIRLGLLEDSIAIAEKALQPELVS